MKETQQSISKWGQDTFGLDAMGIIIRMNVEVAELLVGLDSLRVVDGHNPAIVDLDKRIREVVCECADIYIMQAQVASKLGLGLPEPEHVMVEPWMDDPLLIGERIAGWTVDLLTAVRHRSATYLLMEGLLRSTVQLAKFFGADLSAEVDAKMAKNRKRVWARQANGKVQHVEVDPQLFRDPRTGISGLRVDRWYIMKPDGALITPAGFATDSDAMNWCATQEGIERGCVAAVRPTFINPTLGWRNGSHLNILKGANLRDWLNEHYTITGERKS